jgi:hypothetical protein
MLKCDSCHKDTKSTKDTRYIPCVSNTVDTSTKSYSRSKRCGLGKCTAFWCILCDRLIHCLVLLAIIRVNRLFSSFAMGWIYFIATPSILLQLGDDSTELVTQNLPRKTRSPMKCRRPDTWMPACTSSMEYVHRGGA